MAEAITVSCGAVASMLALALTEHRLHPRHLSVRIFWLAPLVGALLMLLLGVLSPAEVWQGLTADTAVNPLKILILFFAMTLMSVFLDEAGFFRYLAGVVLTHAGTSQKKLFAVIPYVVTILVLIITSIRKKRENQPPASLGLSYFREER